MSKGVSNIYKIGDIIKKYRTELRYSQEHLCYGVCTPGNLSKIENGSQIPSRNTFEALMQRMGKSPEMYPSFMSEEDVEKHNLRHKMLFATVHFRYEEATELLNQYTSGYTLDRLDEQFAILIRCIVLLQKPENAKECLADLTRALEMTVPDFDVKNILRYALTREELIIINNIAVANNQLKNEDLAIRMMIGLREFLEDKVINTEEKAVAYTMVLYNLSKWLGAKGLYRESRDISELGIQNCKYYGRLPYLPHLIYNKGYCCFHLSETAAARRSMIQAYYIFDALKNPLAKHVLKFIKENFSTPRSHQEDRSQEPEELTQQ